jgi:hypothetical protein
LSTRRAGARFTSRISSSREVTKSSVGSFGGATPSTGTNVVKISGRSLRGITLPRFQQSAPYARAKS